jgi:hypothetical protein
MGILPIEDEGTCLQLWTAVRFSLSAIRSLPETMKFR